MGNQEPRSGDAYAGIMLSPGSSAPYREYIQTKLSQRLIPGQTYEVSWYVSLAERSSLTLKGWGAYFSKTEIDSTGYILSSLLPQVQSHIVVRDTNQWMRISGTFVAARAFQYLNIGFFAAETQSNWALTGHGSQNCAYYFIDDVIVKPIFPIVLPVTEVNLSANRLPSGEVKLNWISMNEQMLSHYEIERADAAGQFAPLTQPVLATGLPQEMAEYSYEDASTFGQNELHYRLRMVDLDGNFAYSKVVSVSLNPNEKQAKVGPNPFENEVRIDWQQESTGSLHIQIISSTGQRVKQKSYYREAGLHHFLIDDLHDLPAGVYFVQIQD